MRKKIVSVVLCSIMTAALVLTGCGKSSDSSSKSSEKTTAEESSSSSSNSKYKKEITIDVFDAMANYQGVQSGWFAKVVKEKFNMKLNIIAPNVAGGGDTLFQTRSTAGNLGDLVIIGTENGKLKDTVKAGLLKDMSKLLKGKDVMKNYKMAISKTNELTGKKGVYALPSEISNQSPNASADGIEPLVENYVRWDAYKKAGYPTINTLDDLIPVLKKMQSNTPKSDSGKKTYAISLFKDWDGETMMAASNYASLYGYKNTGFVFSKADGSEHQDATDSNGIYVKALKFLFEANKAGLIDPESTTQNYDMLSDKYRDGQILTSLWSYQGSSLYNTTEHKKAGKGFMPATIKDSTPYTSGCYSEGNSKTIIAIGSKAKDPQRLADFIDWMYSPEGMECVGQANGAAGPEGLTWEKKDGKAVYTSFGDKALPSNDVKVDSKWGGGSWKDGICTLNFKPLSLTDTDPNTNEPYMATMWDYALKKNNTKLDKDWQSKSGGAKTTIEHLQKNKQLAVGTGTSYTQPEESSDISTLRNQCKSTIVDSSWKMIFAKDEAEFNSILKDMQKTVKGLGYDKVLKVDMKNAKDKAASAKQALKDYNAQKKSK